jgi:high-affinity iron transporter
MQEHARGLSKELQHKSDAAISSGKRIGLAILAFQAVGREGLETMVFTLAIIFANSNQAGTALNGKMLWLGAILGIVIALGIAYVIYKLGVKINLKRFFQVLGILLMIFAAGLISDAVENFQQLGWIKFGQSHIWNSSKIISEGSNIGDALHSLIGYADQPSILQAIAWLVYIAIVVSLFLGFGKVRKPKAIANN